jgi:hypothetical protein
VIAHGGGHGLSIVYVALYDLQAIVLYANLFRRTHERRDFVPTLETITDQQLPDATGGSDYE